MSNDFQIVSSKKLSRERFKMKPDYDDVARYVCGDNWMNTDPDERDGGYGVAMTLAYMNGIPAKLGDMSAEVGVPPFVLETAFKRLQVNGIFCHRSPLLDDSFLRNEHDKSETSKIKTHVAWCNIAGLASGFIGKGFLRSEYASMSDNASMRSN